MIEPFAYQYRIKNRGETSDVKRRLCHYIPFLAPIARAGRDFIAVDLSCGEGEALHLFRDLGFNPVGLDSQAKDRDAIDVSTGFTRLSVDPLEWLQSQESGSVAVVFSVDIVQCIPRRMIYEIVQEAFRVLIPGGLLILQQPHPQVLVRVPDRSFGAVFEDGHSTQAEPQLLPELYQYVGFKIVKSVPLYEGVSRDSVRPVTLMDVLSSASAMVGVIGQKESMNNGNDIQLIAFAQEYGTTIYDLATRFESRIQELEDSVHRAEAALSNIHHSYLWRITAPLRWIEQQIWQLKNEGIKERLQAFRLKIARIVRHKLDPKRNLSQSELHHKQMVPPSVEGDAYRSHNRLKTLDEQGKKIHKDLMSSDSR